MLQLTLLKSHQMKNHSNLIPKLNNLDILVLSWEINNFKNWIKVEIIAQKFLLKFRKEDFRLVGINPQSITSKMRKINREANAISLLGITVVVFLGLNCLDNWICLEKNSQRLKQISLIQQLTWAKSNLLRSLLWRDLEIEKFYIFWVI